MLFGSGIVGKEIVKNKHKISPRPKPKIPKRIPFRGTKAKYIEKYLTIEGSNVDFSQRKYLLPIHNESFPYSDKRIVLRTGRQVEKCQVPESDILTPSGITKKLSDISVGDMVVSYDTDYKYVKDKVVSLHDNGERDVYEVTTRLGNCIYITLNHRLMKLSGFEKLENLNTSDMIGCVKSAGEFTGSYEIEDNRCIFLGYKICDLSLNYVPAIVFDFSKKSTAIFINTIWMILGYVCESDDGRVHISCNLKNRPLSEQLRCILWKFGIPTMIMEVRDDSGKPIFVLKVVTEYGINNFISNIGAVRKLSDIKPPEYSIIDEYKEELFPNDIRQYLLDKCDGDLSMYPDSVRDDTNDTIGINDISECIDNLDKSGKECDLLKNMVAGDVLWEQLNSIKYVGKRHVLDIETELYHNYVSNGIITHNSSSLSFKILMYSSAYPWFKTLYVSPTQIQTRQFSNDRIKPCYDNSPFLKKMFEGKGTVDQVFDKKLNNGSMTYFRYAYLHPDRCRGLSADLLCLDEIQDLITDGIPVIRECLSHSKFKKEIYSGTPKTTSNAIEFYWDKSTQNEWLSKCQWCNYWNMMDMSVIGETSYICSKCKKPLTVSIGEWVSMRPDNNWAGFRISQLMVPWLTFEEIKQKMIDYSQAKFYNEVLGLPYDSGSKPITEAQLRSCCSYGNIMIPPDPQALTFPVFAGIDWGSGEGENPSYTVLTLGAFFNPSLFTIFFIKKFIGQESDLLKQPGIIGQLFRRYDMNFAIADWGYGHAQNLQLRQAWGIQKIAECEYVSQKIPLKYEPANFRFKVDRTTMMTKFFNELKTQKIQFFDWSDFKTFGQDFLNIDCEFNEKRKRMTYVHRPDRPDDTFHASLYCWLAGKQYYNIDE